MFFRIIHPPPQFCILYIFLFLFAIFIGFLPKKVLAIHLTKCYNEAHNSAELVEYTKKPGAYGCLQQGVCPVQSPRLLSVSGR